MLVLIGRRLVSMALIMAVVSFILFLLFETDKLGVAGKVLGPYSSTEQREIWLENNGYNEPFLLRYFDWAGNALVGDFGGSIQLKVPVSEVLWSRLGNTAILAGVVFAVMIPLSLTLGVLAGLKEASLRDRSITVISVITTSVPEFASATLLTAIFVFWLGWLPGTSAMTGGFAWNEIIFACCRIGSVRVWLYHPNDAGINGRGHDVAVHSNSDIKGAAVPANRASPCTSKCVDCSVHGHRIATELAVVRSHRG